METSEKRKRMGIVPDGPYTVRVGRRRLHLAEPVVRKVRGETAVIPTGGSGWNAGYALKKARLVYRCLVPGSVEVRSAEGHVYKNGKDYRLVRNWPRIVRIAGGRIGAAEPVRIGYAYRCSRMDLVQVSLHGVVSVKNGRPDLTCPLLPRPDKGCTAVAGIYVAAHARRIRRQDILPIKETAMVRSPRRLPDTVLGKLRGKRRFTFIAFGDSITRGGDASSPARCWFGLLSSRLRKKFGPRVRMINAGIGGNTSSQGLARITRDVLSQRPDLVTVGFGVNDENGPQGGAANTVPLERYRNNLERMIRRLRKNGAEVILLTPTPKNPGWEHTSRTIGRYAQTVRELGREFGLPVADIYRAWNNLKNKGIPYLTFLSTCINHPNDHGHRLMAGTIEELFE